VLRLAIEWTSFPSMIDPNPTVISSSCSTRRMRAIQPITSVPSYAVQEEHTSIVASTPLSFNQIPPVIKHKEDNVTVAVDPPIQGFSDPELKGTLYILTRSVSSLKSSLSRSHPIISQACSCFSLLLATDFRSNILR